MREGSGCKDIPSHPVMEKYITVYVNNGLKNYDNMLL
jgi:hypothetical protein